MDFDRDTFAEIIETVDTIREARARCESTVRVMRPAVSPA